VNFMWRNRYRFWLLTNIPLRALALISVHATANKRVPGLLTILHHNMQYRGKGGDTDNREDTSNRSYSKQTVLLQSSHLKFQLSTHIHILPVALYFPMNRVDIIFLSSFNHAFPKIQCQLKIA
jgi:hypothetical protein